MVSALIRCQLWYLSQAISDSSATKNKSTTTAFTSGHTDAPRLETLRTWPRCPGGHRPLSRERRTKLNNNTESGVNSKGFIFTTVDSLSP